MGLREEGDRHPSADAIVAPGAITALIARLAHAPTQQQAPVLVPGARVGHYEIIRAIGHGGFGTVYEAHDKAVNRLVALKVLHGAGSADPSAAREAEVAARLAHPNIASLYDAGVLDTGVGYLVYEILHGETLEDRLARGPVPPNEALAVAAQIAHALAYAHAHGVVHRDLKPANVFLTAEGDVKVLDFGVALLLGRAGPAGGTPAYMAPEQRRGEPEDARTDLYALGLILREMITRDRGATDAAHVERIAHAVRRVLSSLMADDPAVRPRSARAACAELEAARRAVAAPGVRRRRMALVVAATLATAVGAAVLVRERLRTGPVPASVSSPSIAVLPFADLSPGKDEEYLADGIAEEILTALAQVDGLRVVGRTSSFTFKARGEDLRTIAGKLNVRAVLEGSVRKAGIRIRVAARLVSAADGYEVWSDTYDRNVSDVFAVQEDIARSVVEALKVKLLPGHAPTASHRTPNPEVYNEYLIGRQAFHHGADKDFDLAIGAYERALALDPSYAPAWAALAVSLNYRSSNATDAVAISADKKRALAAADKAVVLAPDLADGFAARAFLRADVQRDWMGAEADLRHAMALSPGDPEVHRLHGGLVASLRRLPEAVASLRRATDLDPLSPSAWNSLGWILIGQGDLVSAQRALARALAIAPDHAYASGNLAVAQILERRAADAIDTIARYPGDDVHRLTALALAHHALGHRSESQQALDTLVAHYTPGAAYQVAQIYAVRGDRDRTFAWLEQAYVHLDGGLRFITYDPLLSSIRSDSRYAALVQRMNLPAE